MTASEMVLARRLFWRRRRLVYNGALVAACVGAAVLMLAVMVAWHFFPVEPPAGEVGLPGQIEPFSLFLAPILFAIGMLLANIFYLLGPLSEILVRPREPDLFRRRVFALGLWFSVSLPLLVPAMSWGFFVKIHLFGT